MAQGSGEDSGLVKLDEFDGELDEQWHDAKGLKVLDKHGDEVGTVEELYIHEEAQAVHLIKIEVEGKYYLIPVDAVTTVSEEEINVEQNKDMITGSPEYDSEDVPDSEVSRAAHEHFGYPDQLALGQG